MRPSIVSPAAVALALLLALPSFAQKRRAVRHPSSPVVSTPRTIVLAPVKDNTLYQNDDGAFSNGVGIHVFAGNTATSSRRRAVLAFDLTQIPPGSQVTRVSLKMTVSMSLNNSGGLALHALLADWGEGSSNAGPSADGGGTPSRMNDATWIHRFFPAERWTTPGGDFTSTADAAPRTVSSNSVTWETAGMIARVQQWVDQPPTNFGWIVIGDERSSRTAKRFDSREVTGATKPSLTVEYIPR